MQIDFVIPWVDGNDPAWISRRDSFLPLGESVEECRFRDWNILKYWFRAVDAYAPWVNTVHFITDDQLPSWLNIHHPKLHIVDHRDYIPSEYLPTFSSHTIELNLHRIEGLAEHFVYFNDDMMLNTPVRPEDFFQNGLPCDCAILDSFLPVGYHDAYTHAQCNVMAFINAHFDKHTLLRRYPQIWYAPVYGKYFLKNIYLSHGRYFSNFQNGHIPSSMLKSTFEMVWQMEPELLDRTCRHRFRSLEDVNQYIMSYFDLCVGKFIPRSPSFGQCYRPGIRDNQLYDDILTGKHKVICINDNPEVTDFEGRKAKLTAVYEQKLPVKSTYEL